MTTSFWFKTVLGEGRKKNIAKRRGILHEPRVFFSYEVDVFCSFHLHLR